MFVGAHERQTVGAGFSYHGGTGDQQGTMISSLRAGKNVKELVTLFNFKRTRVNDVNIITWLHAGDDFLYNKVEQSNEAFITVFLR